MMKILIFGIVKKEMGVSKTPAKCAGVSA